MQRTQGTILISIYYLIGLLAFFSSQIPLLASILLIITIVILHKKLISSKLSIVLYFFFVVAIINCHFQIKDFDMLSKIAPQKAKIEGRIESIPTTNHSDKTKFYLNVNKINYSQANYNNLHSKTIVTLPGLRTELNNLEIGDKIEIEGKINLPRKAKNPSQFDYRSYLRNFDTHTVFYANENSQKIITKADTPYWKILQKINKTRNQIIKDHSQNIKSPNIELLGGIIFGDDAVNPPDYIKTSFINSGLLHILAASGMNVTLIFGIWFFISQKFRVHYRFSILSGIFLIIFYTAMTGFGPSILRASIMLIFILLGKLIDRDADNIALLFFVALLLLLYDPAMINLVGFQLSFVVTFGLLLTCPVLFDKIENKFLNIILSTCLVPLIAQLYAAPLQMFYFNTFSTYSILANIAIVPFLAIVSFLGFVSSIIAMITPISLYVCKISSVILNPLLSSLIFISDYFANLPYSLLTTTHPSIIQITLYYISIISVALFLKSEFKNKKLLITTGVALLLFIILLIPIKNNNCEIIFFDMGNADSALIKTPENKYILIDTGKAPYKSAASDARQVILKYFKDNGIKNLDALVLTHFDADHAGGSMDILPNIKVKNVYINNLKSDNNIYRKIISYLKNNKIDYEVPKENQLLIKEKNLSFINATRDEKKLNDENEESLITLLKYNNFNILFMGDAGTKSFLTLNNKYKNNIDILKVGHHGSENSINQKMLDDASVDVAIISTGENPYGHPDKKIINLLRKNNINIFRTDNSNATKAVISDRIELLSFNTKKRQFQKSLSTQ